MMIDLKFNEPPCKIDDVIFMNYSFDNLHKFLNFLLLTDKEAYSKLHDISIKLNEIDELKQNINETTDRVAKCENRFVDIDKTFNSYRDKFSDIDGKFSTILHRLNGYDDELKTQTMKLSSHDDLLIKLKYESEENSKSIVKIFEINEKLRHSNELLQDKIDKCEKYIIKIQNELLRFNEVEKNIKENRALIDENNKNFTDFQYNTSKKFSENDSNILNIVNTLQELTKQANSNSSQKAIPISSHLTSISNSDGNSSMNLDLINKANKEIENLKKFSREFTEKIEKLSKSEKQNEEVLTDLNTKMANIISGKLAIKSESNSETKKNSGAEEELNLKFDPDSISPAQSIEIIYDQIQKMQDAIKNVSSIANSKPSKEEMEKISRIANSEVEKISNKLAEANKAFETKIKQIAQALAEFKSNPALILGVENTKIPTSFSEEKFQESLTTIATSLLEEQLPVKINEFFNLNEIQLAELKAALDLVNSNTSEIQRIESELKTLSDSLSESKSASGLDGLVHENKRRIVELEGTLTRTKDALEVKIKSIEGDGFQLDDELQSSGGGDSQRSINYSGSKQQVSFSDAIKILNQNLKMNSGKIDKVRERQDNMNSEILQKVKKDLSQESGKILDEFRCDLKVSIGRIEEQLREKVDRFSLDEFGRRVDNKLHSEFNKKIDRNDLKKNNNLINKKIDTLENKISKTLVDTLIDLQMDDAPLIVKKSLFTGKNSEKCASCNQSVGPHNKDNLGYQTFYGGTNAPFLQSNGNNDDDLKANNYMNMTQGKFKFRNIQDNSNKFGTGSYSRYLSNIENVNEEIRLKGVNLPDISARNMKNLKNSIVMGNGFNKVRIDELAGKQFNSMINEELEKNIVNPDNLIKTANKIFDSVEKRNAGINNLK